VPSSRWFASVDLELAPPSVRRLLDGFAKLLDHLNPTKLDAARSVARSAGETAILIAHASDTSADLDVAVADSGWTNFYGLHGHDEAYGDDPPGAWEADALEIFADLLQRRYLIEDVSWRSHHVERRITDLATADTRSSRTMWRLLPLRPSELVSTTREVDFGCGNRVPGPKTP